MVSVIRLIVIYFVSSSLFARIRLVVNPINIKVAIASAKATIKRKEVLTRKIQLAQMNDSLNVIKSEIDQLAQIKNSLSEMGEMENIRLQMAVDRLCKMMSTFSTIIEKDE